MNEKRPTAARSGLKWRRSAARWLRRALFGLLVLVLGGALVRAWLPKPVSVETALVERGEMRVSVDEDGLARVEDRYIVSAPLSGTISRIELEPGDEIDQSRTIARLLPIPPPLLDTRAQRTAEAQVSVAAAAQKRAQAQIERARASLELVRKEADRTKTLFERGAVTAEQLEQAQFKERTALADHESARFGTRVADHELRMARAALSHMSPGRASVDSMDVPSPVAGRVLRVMQKSEGVVQAGTPLVEIGDPAALEVVVDVLTSDAVRIRPAAHVSIARWGGPPLAGRVKRVEPSAFTRISALGVEEQRVNVRIDLVDPRSKWSALGDGYRVEAQIVVWEASDVVRVPLSAVFRHEGAWAVFAVREELARLVVVEIGERTAREVQILRGVETGERVIVHPGDSIRDGTEVSAR